MSYYVPDQPLDPPDEPELRKSFTCELCNNAIYEGEDYYDIPGIGVCCEDCIDTCKRYDAEAPYEGSLEEYYDNLRDQIREESMFNE